MHRSYYLPSDFLQMMLPALPAEAAFYFPCGVGESHLALLELHGIVIGVLTGHFDFRSLRTGPIKVFKVDTSVRELHHGNIAVSRFQVWSKDDSIPGIKFRLHAITFNDDGEGVWIFAVGFDRLLDLVCQVFICAGGTGCGPTNHRSLFSGRLRDAKARDSRLSGLIPKSLRRKHIVLSLFHKIENLALQPGGRYFFAFFDQNQISTMDPQQGGQFRLGEPKPFAELPQFDEVD